VLWVYSVAFPAFFDEPESAVLESFGLDEIPVLPGARDFHVGVEYPIVYFVASRP